MSTRNAAVRANRPYTGSAEWYTPGWLLERIDVFFGDHWYDPCPASYGKLADNGLAVSWAGKQVYCNPPYGYDILPWIRKARTEPTRELIMLTPAYTETAWFAPFYACDALLFFSGRLRFERPDHTRGQQAPHPSVLVYRGRRWRKFAEAFNDLGPVLRTAYPRRLAAGGLGTAELWTQEGVELLAAKAAGTEATP